MHDVPNNNKGQFNYKPLMMFFVVPIVYMKHELSENAAQCQFMHNLCCICYIQVSVF